MERFLQNGPDLEPDQIAALSKALREAKPVKVALTNYRKDGTKFKNLLAMKPIFDSEGNYRFSFADECFFEVVNVSYFQINVQVCAGLPN